MPNKPMITALAILMTVATAAHADVKKKKKPAAKPEEQSEKSDSKEAMDALVLGVAAGVLTGAMKKGKLPKGGKLIMKQGIKAVKESAKKDGKKDSGKKKDPLKMLLGGGDDE